MTSRPSPPRVFIVGGGFAGLAAAKALADAPVEVTVIDRRNHHVFRPLLYQVATASLSPADISAPIRTVLRGQGNSEVALAEVTGVDLEHRRLRVANGYVEYDYLVLAAGATHAYFGHPEWAELAPGLKSIEDATALRRHILLAFETAEFEGSEDARRAVLMSGIVGAGPTGVELAGAIKEIAGRTIPEDYKHIDTRTTRVILFEGGDRVLSTFRPELSARALRDLERMGVEVRLNSRGTGVMPHGIRLGDEFIAVRNVFWAAGVQASELGRSTRAALDRAGRVIVGPDLAIPGHSDVYRDKGTMAVIGKAKAVVQIGEFSCGGFLAWLLWGGIHIIFLVGFRNRVQVAMSWFWNWLLNARDARLITGDAALAIEIPCSSEFVVDVASATTDTPLAPSEQERTPGLGSP